MRTTGRRYLMLCAAALVAAVLPGVAGAWTLEEALSRVDQAYEVRVARAAVEAASRELASLGYAGDASVSVDPGAKTTTAAGAAFPGRLDLTGSVTLRVPVSLTAAGRDKAEAARSALGVAVAALESSRAATHVAIYSLYQRAWLARAELDVLELEAESARANAAVAGSRYEAGEISLTELKRAEDDVQRTQDALLQGGLAQRLSWLELVYATGQEKQPGETVDAASPAAGELPQVTDLVDWSAVHLQSVVEQRARVEAITQSLRTLRAPPLEIDARLSGGYLTHSATLSVDTATRLFAATYSFDIATAGIPDGDTASWSIGVSAGISLDIGKGDRLAVLALEADLEQEAERLRSLLRSVELTIRSRYQQWIRAQDGIEQARRSVERSTEAAAIVEAGIEVGQASSSDRLLARAALERARWALAKASVTAEEARLATALAAGYLAELVELGR